GRYSEAALGVELYVAALAPLERGKLTYEAAFAHYRNMDVELSERRFLDTIAIAQEHGDIDLWSRALVGWIRAQVSHGGISGGQMLPRERLDAFVVSCAGHELARARVEI